MFVSDECIVERLAEVFADGQELCVTRLACQTVGIVCGIVERCALEGLIDLASGTVDGFTLSGIDFADAVAEAVHLLVDVLDVQCFHEEEVAVAYFLAHPVLGFPIVQIREHLLCGSLDVGGLHQALDELDDDVAHAGQHMLRAYIVVGQVAQGGERLQVAHQAVVEVNHLRMLDFGGFDGPFELVHVHASAIEALVVEHGTRACNGFLVEVVLGIEACSVAVEHDDVVLGGCGSGSPVQLSGQVLLAVELELRFLLEACSGAQFPEVGLSRQFEAQHFVLVGKPATEGVLLRMVPVLVEEEHTHLFLPCEQGLHSCIDVLDDVVHVTARVAVDEQRIVCQIFRRCWIRSRVVVVVAARYECDCAAKKDGSQHPKEILFHCLLLLLLQFHFVKVQLFIRNRQDSFKYF